MLVPPSPSNSDDITASFSTTSIVQGLCQPKAISHARRQIQLMQEYRTRLIADVVTGKLDAREAVADEAEVPTP